MDAVLRYARKIERPFGGVQLVLVGDFLQLPPVVQYDDADVLMKMGYKTPYCFSAKSLANVRPSFIRLQTVRRQTDPVFIEILGNFDVESTSMVQLPSSISAA